MTKNKYLISIILAFIAIGFTVSPTMAQPQMLPPNQVSTHGPLVNELILNVYSSDSAAFLALTSGQIQGMEWTLTPSEYATAQTTPNVYANVTPEYGFDAIAFNTLIYPYSNVHFRRAIAYLMNYPTLQQDIGSAAAAGPWLYWPTLYTKPTSAIDWYNQYASYPYTYNLNKAMSELLQVPGMAYNKATGTWTLYGKQFSPVLYYRSDDPIRTYVSEVLTQSAAQINLTITDKPVTGVSASSVIYSPASSVVISPGTMLGNYSTIPPVYNMTLANQTDTWGMYTLGWLVSWEANWPFYFFNSQFSGVLDYGNFFNETMDYYTDSLYYNASSLAAAQQYAYEIQQIFNQQLPYVITNWDNLMYANNVKGWTGFAQIPTVGPNEETGLYYTSLNVHPSNAPYGGVYTEALHSAPSSLDPLYSTNWVWQVDAWQEVYDSPLATPPWGLLNGSIIPWMGTYSLQSNVNLPVGSGSGWWNPFNTSKIVKGQVLTINFYPNDTWQDGVPLTAYDFNFSLYYWDLNGLSGASTPNSYALPPPLGLVATYIPPNNPHEIQIFINSTNIWNEYTVDIAVIPMHIFEYFSPSAVASATGAMDTTVPLSQLSGLSSYLNSPNESLPQWMYWLPNLEVGSGPFVFQSWNKVTNVQTLTRNVNYYRSAWYAWMSSAVQGSKYPFSVNINEEIYNPTSSAFDGVASKATGYIPITNATGTVSVVNPATGYVYETEPLTSLGNGSYAVPIPTLNLAPGTYELMTNATYNSFGLNRVWYSYSGLTISSPTQISLTLEVLNPSGQPLSGATVTVAGISGTTNSSGYVVLQNVPVGSQTMSVSASGYKSLSQPITVSVSNLTTVAKVPLSAIPPNYTPYYAAIIILIIVIIIAVAIYMRRK